MSIITIIIIVFILFFLFLIIISTFSSKEQESEKNEEEYERLRKEIYGKKAYNQEKKFERQTERNLAGKELEKKGKIEEAIKQYEQNVKEGFIGSHPYTRLAIIYRKRKQFDEEIRVLKKAVSIFEDGGSKLEKFLERLNKAELLKKKRGTYERK